MSVLGDPDGRSSDQVDAAFAQIVAGYDATPGEATWPESEDVAEKPQPSDPSSAAAPAAPTGPVWPAGGPVLNRDPRAVGPDEPSLLDGLDSFGADLPDDDAGPFVPPPPPPLPRISVQAVFGVIAIFAGLWLFFDTDLLPLGEQASMVLGLVGVIGGAAALIMRLRPGGPDDPDLPDDGAVV
ncbi:MAG: hypothetical protein HOV79_18080 [Hamadaea sp.]|nr:hypothetical protein [Hamadaea sp.]